ADGGQHDLHSVRNIAIKSVLELFGPLQEISQHGSGDWGLRSSLDFFLECVVAGLQRVRIAAQFWDLGPRSFYSCQNCEVRVLPSDFINCPDKSSGDAATPFALSASWLLKLVDH